ncbi:MAG: hypothetical protein RIQ52_2101 [Pseudomonadota bacterium]|jgi:dihydroorotase
MSGLRTLIKGGYVVDPAGSVEGLMDIAVEGARIVGVASEVSGFTADIEVDASGCLVMPGLIDLAARLREPGQEHKASLQSELAAAAAGGITTLCCPPDTLPVIDTPAVVQWIGSRALQAGKADILPIAALTQGLKGQDLASMSALRRAGCRAVSNAGRPVATTRVLRHALEYAADQALLVMMHPVDDHLKAGGRVHEGLVGARLGLPGIPEFAETVALGQILPLVRHSGVRMHFSQISSAGAVSMIAEAKAQGLPVTADVAVHQLHLDEHDVGDFDPDFHVYPPFRSREDRAALRQAVLDGVVDAVCSDHQPHDGDAKLDAFPATEPGMASLQTLLPLMVRFQQETGAPWQDLVERLVAGPARILGLQDRGQLRAGMLADLCIMDAGMDWQVSAQTWLSQGRNTPFWGQSLPGVVKMTLFRGEVSYQHPDWSG